MRFRKLPLYLLPVLPALVVLSLLRRGVFLFGDTSFSAFDALVPGEMFPLLHFSTNSFVSWRFEPASFALLYRFGFGAYMAWLYFLLGLGLLCAVRQVGKLNELRSAFTSLAVVMLFLHFFALDVLVVTFATALVWQTFVLSRFGELSKPSLKEYCFVALSTLVSCSLANQFALLSTIFAAAFSLGARERGAMPIAFAIVLGYALFFPSPEFPDYGAKGHVVPYYGVADGLQPLIGDEPPLFHVNRQAIRAAFVIPALQLVILSAGLLLILRPRRISGGSSGAPLFAALALSLSLVLDSAAADPGLSQIAPLQSLSRVLPGMFFVSPVPFALAAALIACSFFAASNIFSTALFVCCLILTLRGEPLSSTLGDELLWRETTALSDSTRTRTVRLLRSPSYWLMREYGLAAVALHAGLKDRRFTPAKDLSLNVVPSLNEPATPLMRDGDDATAWGTRTGGQRGDEWLNFIFPEPRKVLALRLDTGKFFTDFPRGLEVRTASSCDEADRDFENYAVVFPSRENQGGIQFTPQGYPYFTTQYATSIALPPDQTVKCILVRQTGVDKNFDWSVSEVSFALE